MSASASRKHRAIPSHSGGLRSSTSIGGSGGPASNTPTTQTTNYPTSSGEITVGSQVCLRKVPMYHSGSIGFTVAGGVPKVGQLLNAAWNVTDTCRFKIIQPPKKPKLPELPKEKVIFLHFQLHASSRELYHKYLIILVCEIID